MKAINIIWDVDDPEDLEDLPDEIEIPEELVKEYFTAGDDVELVYDEIGDYLSDETGFCHCGFELKY